MKITNNSRTFDKLKCPASQTLLFLLFKYSFSADMLRNVILAGLIKVATNLLREMSIYQEMRAPYKIG